jgi:hypothetical protein
MIEKGYCQCGCGRKTTVSPITNTYKGWVKGEPKRFIQGHRNKSLVRKSFISNGYVFVYQPNHHKANSLGYVREHVIKAEKVFGKPLPTHAVIHHPFGKANNTCFVICENQGYHRFLERRQQALLISGHANWRKCPYCKQYDDPINLHIKGRSSFHMKCSSEYTRHRRLLKSGLIKF